jgi:hypothetical protein
VGRCGWPKAGRNKATQTSMIQANTKMEVAVIGLLSV